jgi:hypothetical protein
MSFWVALFVVSDKTKPEPFIAAPAFPPKGGSCVLFESLRPVLTPSYPRDPPFPPIPLPPKPPIPKPALPPDPPPPPA